MTAAAAPLASSSTRADPGSLRAAWRVFWHGGLLSYGALFNWARPSIYIPTLIGGPTFQLFFFAALGSFATNLSPAYFALGNAVQVSALAGVFGMTMAIANERWFGTLPALLASPANRAAIFAGRFLPHIANGLFVSVYAIAIGVIFLGVQLDPETIGVVALALVITVFSCTAIGSLQGAISLRLRDGLFGANLLMMAFLLFCGVNIPLETLPPWMQAIGNVLPFTHGLQAVRLAADGAGLSEVGGLIAIEFGIGCVYAVMAFVLFSVLERSARQNATLDVR
ncbi:MAG TPA: ABC transporter permease [Candidatus Limnocylindria bacterium]|nr:ABC transporter permease [Candidatus Limnocylindria bacterium]